MAYDEPDLCHRTSMTGLPRTRPSRWKTVQFKLPKWLVERVHYSHQIKEYHGIFYIDPYEMQVWTCLMPFHVLLSGLIHAYHQFRVLGAYCRK